MAIKHHTGKAMDHPQQQRLSRESRFPPSPDIMRCPNPPMGLVVEKPKRGAAVSSLPGFKGGPSVSGDVGRLDFALSRSRG